MASVQLPVLVVGGGIGGLTAALALHRAGFANKLILREKSFRVGTRNAAIVAGPAVRILDRLGLGPLLRTYGSPIVRGEVQTSQGKSVVSLDLDKIGSQAWVVPRPSLQQFFVEALPPDTIHFGTKLRSLKVHTNKVLVEVQHEPDEVNPLSPFSYRNFTSRIGANLVVGADGLSSTVRAGFCKPMLRTSGTCIWQATTMTRDVETYPAHTFREIWSHSAAKDTERTRFGFTRITADEVTWWAVVPTAGDVFLRPFLPKLLSLFADYPESALGLINSLEHDRELQRHQIRQIWPESTSWIDHRSNRIALVGDAGRVGEVGSLHSGCSFAIEDSYMLAHYIAEHAGKGGSTLNWALRAYAENREAHAAMAKNYTDKFHRLATTRSTIARYFLGKYVMAESRLTQGILPDRR